MKNVLMIVGSIRSSGFNHQLAQAAASVLEGRAQVSFLDFSDLPFLNQDHEFPAPASVARVRQAVGNADALWLFVPEYNYQMSGYLKNLLDWLSRPLSPNDPPRSSAIRGKAAAISGAAGKSGAAGAREGLHRLLNVIGVSVIGGDGVGIAMGPESFGSGKLHLSPEDMAALEQLSRALVEGAA